MYMHSELAIQILILLLQFGSIARNKSIVLINLHNVNIQMYPFMIWCIYNV